MTFFEYVAVLVSIIVALGIAQILSGIARTIEKPEGQEIYWVHLLWSTWLFVYLIFFWWFEFRLGQIAEWTFHPVTQRNMTSQAGVASQTRPGGFSHPSNFLQQSGN